MTKKKSLIAVLVFGFVAACGGPGENADIPEAEPAGESMKNIGGYVVHFSAQSTDQLSPEIARAYNIVRSKNRAMLNVSIIRESDDASVEADVQVKTVNLTGQLKNVTMRKVPDQQAIYYIGETPVANRETLIFDITVRPDGADTASEVRFKRQFYTD
jgi:hypothetical protein